MNFPYFCTAARIKKGFLQGGSLSLWVKTTGEAQFLAGFYASFTIFVPVVLGLLT
jgi:hypothetical protein